MLPQAIQANADTQRTKFSNTVRGSETQIEEFYPELHEGKVGANFSNALGSHLIADVATSPHLVVDLYDYKTESDLINAYGVDLEFLISLRESGLVTLAANLEPARDEHCGWLHEVLAHPHTIFRSIRTPLFFEARHPNIVDHHRDAKSRALATFEGLRSTEIDAYVSASGIFGPRPSPEALADQLAWRWVRLAAMLGDGHADDQSLEQIIRQPDPYCYFMFRDFALSVAPHSAGLGGSFQLSEETAKHLFPELTGRDKASNDMIAFQRLRELLLERDLDLEPAELTSVEYWREVKARGRKRILAELTDSSRKLDLIESERRVRRRLAHSDTAPAPELIEEFLDADKKHRDTLTLIGSLAVALSGYAFSAVADDNAYYFVGGAFGVAGATLWQARRKEITRYAAERVRISRRYRAP